MKNFQNYTPEKYSGPDFEKVEPGIYFGKNPYCRPGNGYTDLFVTSLTFEMEPDSYGEEGGCPQDITQVPFEDILDTFFVFVTDFYDDLNQDSDKTCYQEFGSWDIQNIRNLRTLIGKRFYAVPCEKDGEEYYNTVIE